jgi:hypothetical protein
MADPPLLKLEPDRIATEERRAREKEVAEQAFERARHRMLWQCVALSFAGVPFYAWSWHLTEPREVNLFVATGFVISYALPFFRWLAYHIKTSEEFGR